MDEQIKKQSALGKAEAVAVHHKYAQMILSHYGNLNKAMELVNKALAVDPKSLDCHPPAHRIRSVSNSIACPLSPSRILIPL